MKHPHLRSLPETLIHLSVLLLVFVLPGRALGAAETATADSILPAWRSIAWNPGIPGGIPQPAGPTRNILDYGADPTGVADSHGAIVQAIDALPAGGGVVYIPEGTYRLGSALSIGRDHITFRGSGWKSKLLLEAGGNSIEVLTYRRGNWQVLPQGAAKDSLWVLTGNGSAFTPGEFAEIDQENDSLLMYTDTEWIVSWAENSVGQVFQVVAVKGDTVWFRSPVNHSFSTDLHARIRPQGLVQNVGFEDLYLEKTVANGSTLLFKNAAYCWVRNVESYHTRTSHVDQNTCLGNVVRDSYFHNSYDYGGGGSGYGVTCNFHVTATLVENNMFDSLRHAMLIQLGANGNVYGYNYSAHPVQGEGETHLNQGWDPPDISIHGHYPFMNLFEGNDLEELGIGDYWGPAGPGNTYFRNRVKGEGIIYHDASHAQNLVGNLTTSLKDVDGMSEQKLEHGNKVGAVLQWDPAIESRNLPSSYYLDSVPSFFGDRTWPVFGPEVEEGVLPARERFENLPYLHVSHDGSPVEQYGKLEFTIENGKQYDNPFDPDEADIGGDFISPSGDTLRIPAYWNGNAWKLRFAGGETGDWSYVIRVRDRDGTAEKRGSFRVTGSAGNGWLQVSDRDPHYLEHHDGTPFYGIGMAVPWLVYDARYYEQPGLLEDLASYGVNLINWLFTSWDIQLLRDSYDRYSMEDAEAFDRLVEDAEAHGIKLVLGIWIHDLLRDAPHPWNGFYDWESNPFNQLTTATGFFSDSASWAFQEKYYRYIIARWGYSRSIGMWHTVAEINGSNAIYDSLAMVNDERGWHNRINRYFLENDPFGHPTTVSGSGGVDFSGGWEVCTVPQAHEYPYPPENLKQNPDRIAYWSDHLFRTYSKPALIGEFGKSLYEEGKSESFLHNGIWAGFMSGACATPLHWWGGQIAERPQNFSTFNETMKSQLTYLRDFAEPLDMASHHFTPLYGAGPEEQPSLTGMPEGRILGLRGDSLSLGWIYHESEYSDQEFYGVSVSYPGLAEGNYRVRFYNAWEGTWTVVLDDGSFGPGDFPAGPVPAPGGVLEFTCPTFTGDLALQMEYAGPLGPDGIPPGERVQGDPGRIRVYPNPARNLVYLENVRDFRDIRIYNSRGQCLVIHEPRGETRISMDLSAFPPGLYLIRGTSHRGHLTYEKLIRAGF